MTEVVARHPRSEATALLPSGHEARVLEPSPPASRDPRWYADDPTDPSGATARLVTPIDDEGVTWDRMADEHPHLEAYVSEHWLGRRRRLTPLPAGFDETRRSLHQLAFFAVAPKRYAATGKLGLRYTRGGFGTPFFGDGEQVRIEGGVLIRQQGTRAAATQPANLIEACRFLGIEYEESWFGDFHDPLPPIDPASPLVVGTAAAVAVGDWFGFATLVLEQARRTPDAEEVSRVQLWPEHFDPAFEMGSSDEGRRASYGASPGDDAHPEPYLYVAAWGELDRSDPYWNDEAFNGASLGYREILDADNQVEAAHGFYRRGYERLTL